MADQDTKGTPAATATVPAVTLAKGETVNAATLASLASDPLGEHGWALGRKVNDKRVRSVARETIDRLMAENRTGYTAHAYTQSEADAIIAAMRSSGRGTPGASASALRERVKGGKA